MSKTPPCTNKKSFSGTETEKIKDIIFYEEEDNLYCFEVLDIFELIDTEVNPWTNKELSEKFLHSLRTLEYNLSKKTQLIQLLTLFPDKPWGWDGYLSSSPNITMKIVEKYSDKPWNWIVLSKNPNITTISSAMPSGL